MNHFTLDYYYEPSILAIIDTIMLGPTLAAQVSMPTNAKKVMKLTMNNFGA